jgi:hypothetical protein
MATNETDSHPSLTNRTDQWWKQPLLLLLGGILAIGYLTWAAVQNAHFEHGPFVSPIYATPWVPSWWSFSPAFILLWIPAGFRATCYYGRKAYYRAGFGDPASCAVEEPYRKGYTGETVFPFVLNNLHRFFLYLAIAMTLLHWFELLQSIWANGSVYLGIGTLIMLMDTVALSLYVLSCHSFRHLFGGNRCFGGCSNSAKVKHDIWSVISAINVFHDRWFWISLISIVIADIYIRMLSMGIIPFDPHFTIFK